MCVFLNLFNLSLSLSIKGIQVSAFARMLRLCLVIGVAAPVLMLLLCCVMLCCAVVLLCYTMLCCAVLCCFCAAAAVLCCCAVLCCAVLYCAAPLAAASQTHYLPPRDRSCKRGHLGDTDFTLLWSATEKPLLNSHKIYLKVDIIKYIMCKMLYKNWILLHNFYGKVSTVIKWFKDKFHIFSSPNISSCLTAADAICFKYFHRWLWHNLIQDKYLATWIAYVLNIFISPSQIEKSILRN